jgi:hypothetical protein
MKKMLVILILGLVPMLVQVSAAPAASSPEGSSAKVAAKPSPSRNAAAVEKKKTVQSRSPAAVGQRGVAPVPTPAPEKGFFLFRWLFGEPKPASPQPTPSGVPKVKSKPSRSAALPSSALASPTPSLKGLKPAPSPKAKTPSPAVAAPSPKPASTPAVTQMPKPKASPTPQPVATPTPSAAPPSPKAKSTPKSPSAKPPKASAAVATGAGVGAAAALLPEGEDVKARYQKAREEALVDFRVVQLREKLEPLEGDAYRDAAAVYIKALFERIRQIDSGLSVPSVMHRENAYLRRIDKGKRLND